MSLGELCKAARMTTTIIVCADGSDLSIAAAASGLEVLRKPDRLVVATVIEPPDATLVTGASGFAGGVVSPEAFNELNDQAQAAGEAIVAELVTALGLNEAERVVTLGHPGHALCALATELSATTIVMGSRGRSGLKRAVLGSVSDHVTRHAPCPVLIIGDAH